VECEKLAPDGAAWLPWRPKFQLQRLPSIIDEAATRVSFTVGTTMLPSFARRRDSWQNHLNGSAYALRGYGVTLGSSSSHDPFFSRKAASS
jgi:hypothetical protein